MISYDGRKVAPIKKKIANNQMITLFNNAWYHNVKIQDFTNVFEGVTITRKQIEEKHY